MNSASIRRIVAASIFRLGFLIIVSVYHDGAGTDPIKPMVSKPGSTSVPSFGVGVDESGIEVSL